MEQTFEFLASPKLIINDTDFALALIANPRNVYDAEKFCNLHTSNGTLYHLDLNYKTVVEFGKIYKIFVFYIGLSDSIKEDSFLHQDGTPLEPHFEHLWKKNEPNNVIPDINKFCEGKLLQFQLHF